MIQLVPRQSKKGKTVAASVLKIHLEFSKKRKRRKNNQLKIQSPLLSLVKV
jgi:hypothetical protein